jgi:CheY-like chemotaxis protein
MKVPRAVSSIVRRADAKPRVLVADDNADVLEMVVELLEADFDIIATASDGMQALDLSLRLDPEIIVSDVSMPKLSGFQILQELRRIGSRAKVVLLTLYQGDTFVSEAIQSGAQGYVLKTRLLSDLTCAFGPRACWTTLRPVSHFSLRRRRKRAYGSVPHERPLLPG